jgi:hypothetical protein
LHSRLASVLLGRFSNKIMQIVENFLNDNTFP